MPLNPPAARPGIGRKGRLAIIGGIGLIVIIGIYVYHQHKRRQDATSADALAFEDPTVPTPDSYAPAMLSPITSGGAGGYSDPGGTVHTYTVQDIIDAMKATELPTGGGGFPPLPTVNINPAVAPPVAEPVAAPAAAVVPSMPSSRRITRTCDQYFTNANGNCWHRITVYYSDGTWKITHNEREHRGKCKTPRSTC